MQYTNRQQQKIKLKLTEHLFILFLFSPNHNFQSISKLISSIISESRKKKFKKTYHAVCIRSTLFSFFNICATATINLCGCFT